MGLKSKLFHFKDNAKNSMIYKSYYKDNIDDNLVYLESRDGNDFTGNILRIAEELSTGDYGNLKINVYAKEEAVNKIKVLSKIYNLKIDKIITKEARATKILEKAKYIFTDSGIRPKFVKRKEQIFINTWHGTPLKLMGFDNTSEEHRIGSIQHAFLSSDYLLYPNEYMKEKMLNSYMIDKIYPGKILMEGYPRNSVFFDNERRDELKSILNLENKEIFIYMPTFRGLFLNRDDEKQKDEINYYLKELDSKLKDNQLLLVKLHVYNKSSIDFSDFKHVEPFPENYEVYDVLNIADVLITDYSSVFFDFANTGRKIVLFNYDEEDYFSYRGTYFSLDELPFPKVKTVEDLVLELNSQKNYDDSEFIKNFCTYDNPDAAKKICTHIFKNKNICHEEKIKNDKENILVFPGALYNNGITSSLINLLNNIDRDEYNYFVTFSQWDEYIVEHHEDIFKKFPEDIQFLPFRSPFSATVSEKLDINKYFLSEEKETFTDNLSKLYTRSFHQQFPDTIRFKSIINFDGYNNNFSFMFTHSDFRTSVWVHNDMVMENQTKDNKNINPLFDVYSQSDNIILVSPDLIPSTESICNDTDKIKIVHNISNYEEIIKRSSEDLIIDDYTTVYNNDIFEVLQKPGKKFITIGRFSPEKGHERLLKAFDEFCKQYNDSQLIIIGGYGDLWDETVKAVDSLNYSKNVTLISNISNPMPILKQCDLFVVSSFYEGWPMVIMEADTLNIPIIATDITGTQWMKDYDGYIVENSQQGILNGLNDYMDGKVGLLNIDYINYNKKAVEEFYSIL